MVKKQMLLLALIVLLSSISPFAKVIYVKTNGLDANTGLGSWTNAKQTISAALTASVSGDSIWLAKGIYTGNIIHKSGVGLFGGFDESVSLFANRDFKNKLTILDGGDLVQVITIPANCISSTRVDGFMIRRGKTNTLVGGAGIICKKNSVPVIANNVIVDCNSGALGGGIFCDTSGATIINNRIIGNVGRDGGGIACSRTSTAKIAGNFILGNHATNASASSGGGIYLLFPSSGTSITNNTIAANHAALGGGIYVEGGTLTVANNCIGYNTTGVYVMTNPTLTYKNNSSYGNIISAYTGLSPDNTNITTNPLFVNVTTGNFHLQSTSPCINTGSNTYTLTGTPDIDGETRPTAIDIGADEYSTLPNSTVTVMVATTGKDSLDGSSWTNAKKTIQEAIYYAAAKSGEVWAKKGTYVQTIRLLPFAYVYGGFDGTETVRSGRNWQTDTTIIDGAKNGKSVVLMRAGLTYSTIDGFTITNGYANTTYSGGGVNCIGVSPSIVNNIISRNKASNNGGGVFCQNSQAIIMNNIFMYDTANTDGGGIFIDTSLVTIASNVFVRNKAAGNGGAICLMNCGASKVINSTAFFNSASTAGGIYLNGAAPVIANNIIAFNQSGLFRQDAGAPVLRKNCVYGNTQYAYSASTAGGALNPGATDIALNPLMVDTAALNYHLSTSSPCINIGNNADVQTGWVDIDNEARIYNNVTVDIGADESPYAAYVPPQPTATMSVNSGVDTTTSVFVEIAISATSPNGTVDSMTFRNENNTNWSGWQPYGTRRVWTVSPGNARKTIYAMFYSSAHEYFYDTVTIYLKARPVMVINNGSDTARSVRITVNAGGIKGIGNLIDSAAYTNAGPWMPFEVYDTLKTGLKLALPNGARKKVYAQFKTKDNRCWYIDSTNVFLKLASTISINNGADTTYSPTVSIKVKADSAFGQKPDSMIFHDEAKWSAWLKYDTVASFTVSTGNGPKKVNVIYKTQSPWIEYYDSSTITYIYQKPVLRINAGADTAWNQSVKLTISAPIIMGSIADSMRFRNEATLTFGAYEKYDTTKLWQLSAVNGAKKVFVEIKKNSPARTYIDSSSIVFVYQSPIVVINDGSDTTYNRNVVLHLTMPISLGQVDSITWKNENGTWNGWKAWNSTISNWMLSDSNGIKKVVVSFRRLSPAKMVADSASVVYLNQPPTIRINNGADTVSDSIVILHLATPLSLGTVDSVRIKNESGAWSAWRTFDTTIANWQLSDSNGLKKVYVEYRRVAPARTYVDSVQVVENVVIVAVLPYSMRVPGVTQLYNPVPNPFVSSIRFRFDVAPSHSGKKVSMRIFNARGVLVWELVPKACMAGQYTIAWNGADKFGRIQGGGAYVCKFGIGNYQAVKRVFLAR